MCLSYMHRRLQQCRLRGSACHLQLHVCSLDAKDPAQTLVRHEDRIVPMWASLFTWKVKAFIPSSPFIFLAAAQSAQALSASSSVRGIYFVATFGLKAGTRILRNCVWALPCRVEMPLGPKSSRMV